MKREKSAGNAKRALGQINKPNIHFFRNTYLPNSPDSSKCILMYASMWNMMHTNDALIESVGTVIIICILKVKLFWWILLIRKSPKFLFIEVV